MLIVFQSNAIKKILETKADIVIESTNWINRYKDRNEDDLF